MAKSHVNMNGSQSTQELSFDEGDDDSFSSGGRPSCVVLADYDSDSLGDLSCEKDGAYVSCRRRGGLKRCITTAKGQSSDSVTFSSVTIRTYAHCVGDNPSVSLGVPLSLSWKVLAEETATIEAYDPVHPQGAREQDLAIPAVERERIVRSAGYGTEDIRNAVRIVNAIKMEREKTLDTMKNSPSEEFIEKLVKGVFNATMRRRSKKMERALLRKLREQDAKRTLALVTVSN